MEIKVITILLGLLLIMGGGTYWIHEYYTDQNVSCDRSRGVRVFPLIMASIYIICGIGGILITLFG